MRFGDFGVVFVGLLDSETVFWKLVYVLVVLFLGVSGLECVLSLDVLVSLYPRWLLLLLSGRERRGRRESSSIICFMCM